MLLSICVAWCARVSVCVCESLQQQVEERPCQDILALEGGRASAAISVGVSILRVHQQEQTDDETSHHFLSTQFYSFPKKKDKRQKTASPCFSVSVQAEFFFLFFLGIKSRNLIRQFAPITGLVARRLI